MKNVLKSSVAVKQMEEKLREQQMESQRRMTAIRSIAIATLAVATCMVSLPIVFTRLQEVDSHLASRNLLRQVISVKPNSPLLSAASAVMRNKRQAGGDSYLLATWTKL
ncbi:unnamed protein product [Nippostrongylus brasiliensis]|uniref:Col_cuticle_N domain-containing protein n=1 Tax=Nippostrongylus brasiliensis TaxID=27835 RepID=A0A0N4Y3M1_NIPBR|nr:unnamed protein product [Nippostrongylus brasiliensis]